MGCMRLVQKKAKGPAKIEIGGHTLRICLCGLSKHKDGICDDSHLVTENEQDDVLYIYDEETLEREEVAVLDDESSDEHDHHKGGCACGGGCGCGHHHHG